MTTYPVRSDHRWMRGTNGGRIRLGQIAWYEEAPALGAVAAVLAATALADGATTVVRAGFTQPDVPRVLTLKGNAASVAGNAVIVGVDSNNQPITETVALAGTAVVNTTRAYARVTSVTLPARGAAGNSVQVGTANIIGLFHELAADVRLQTLFDGAADAGTLALHAEVSKVLFTPVGVFDGVKKLRIIYVV